MSILALDVGDKRIGVARSDELNSMAHLVGFVERKTDEDVLKKLNQFMEEFGAEKIVVGLPRTMKGETGTQAEKVLAFVETLRSHLPYPIIPWDERLTTVQAERQMIAQDMSRAKRRKRRDAVAAEILLQSYLDFSKEREPKKEDV